MKLQRLVSPCNKGVPRKPTAVYLKWYFREAGGILRDDDIVCSVWKHIAELKARLLKLRLIMNIKDFSTVVSTKKVPLRDLKEYENDLLTITDEDEAVGFKYVYQTKITKKTTGERVRSSLGMWDRKETYIDNNSQHLLDRLNEYYA